MIYLGFQSSFRGGRGPLITYQGSQRNTHHDKKYDSGFGSLSMNIPSFFKGVPIFYEINIKG